MKGTGCASQNYCTLEQQGCGTEFVFFIEVFWFRAEMLRLEQIHGLAIGCVYGLGFCMVWVCVCGSVLKRWLT